LAERWSFVGIDHRGHGRGSRDRFTLEDAADDAAAVVRALGIGPVVTIGYSMGGPISMLLAHRHPELVQGMVLQATSMEWRAGLADRLQWRTLWLMGMGLRSRWYPFLLRRSFARLSREYGELGGWAPWLEGEVRRNDPAGIVEAGRALSRYDARQFASTLGIPAGLLSTTKDRLVKPRKQRALAAATQAQVLELRGDHFCTLVQPTEYAALTVELVAGVIERVEQALSSRPAASA
jgi:pimeloyl-ACP methyl ester carboxylesterase